MNRRVLEKYNIDDIQNENVSKINGIIILTIWLLCIISAVYIQSIILGLLCGPLMMGLVGIGHNFVIINKVFSDISYCLLVLLKDSGK